MSIYKIGRIYKIIHNQSNICYVGSTFNTLRDRFFAHKKNYNRYLENKHAEITVFPYFKQYGIENFKILLIKEYEVIDKKHLEIYEQLWIYKLKSINIRSAFNIKKLNVKKYRTNNKERIKEYDKEWREKNKDKVNEYNIKKNKKIDCECGSQYTLSQKARHLRTQKHQKFTQVI